MVDSQRRNPSRGDPVNFENWNLGNAISCKLASNFSCSSGKLPDLR